MLETAEQIIDREIRESAAERLQAIAWLREKAACLLKEAADDEKLLAKQLSCNAAGTHEFETVDGTGMFGDRFQEKCKHCGWVHTC